mmetsp:Transcript_18940/g.26382  ORF Transcript_18940/g.26382 Transcript_18940/m.26382 type:complete len:610 (-) Transcript_18940:313-2142(-)|eukprot:CAMPEP_0184487656 /NCGR_PEP_ID=MMETSP0113_2-20130426/10248_1 /TAXON_ID=91329 /ORGANISM="Norrisiella sphaerica, Strain BC52" /LENGTH=609 /DNA_ID=CAMNT_0026870025 /DNA_START=148 /DNA_END=1977 /DNA_ORIENTATION=-
MGNNTGKELQFYRQASGVNLNLRKSHIALSTKKFSASTQSSSDEDSQRTGRVQRLSASTKIRHRAPKKPRFHLKPIWRLKKQIENARASFPSFDACHDNSLAQHFFIQFLDRKGAIPLLDFLYAVDEYRALRASNRRAAEEVFRVLQRVEVTIKHLDEELVATSVTSQNWPNEFPVREVAELIVSGEDISSDAFESCYRYTLNLVRSIYTLFLTSQHFSKFVQMLEYVRNKKTSLKDFERISLLGTGGFGRVTAAIKKDTQTIYAMKEIPKTIIRKKRLAWLCKKEMLILSKVRSPFVLGLNYSFESSGALHLVFEMCTGGDLFSYLEKAPFSLEQCIFYGAETLLALDHLHSIGYLYRDLKPSNVLLTQTGHCKLSDMGLVIELPETAKVIKQVAGTPGCWAPEILARSPVDRTADYWSFGVLFYVMLHARAVPDPLKTLRDSTGSAAPFWTPFCLSKIDQKPARKDPGCELCRINLRFPSSTDSLAIDFISKLLVLDPKRRLGHGGIKEIQEHKIFHSIDWQKLAEMKMTPPFIPRTKPLYIQNLKSKEFPAVRNTTKEKELFQDFYYINEAERYEEFADALNDKSLVKADRRPRRILKKRLELSAY